MNKRIRRVVLFFAVCVLLVGIAKRAYGEWKPEIGTTPLLWETSLTTESLEPIDKVVMFLAKCESSNNPLAYVANDGGSPSAGILQYKLPTFHYFSELYNVFPNAEAKELDNLWKDPDAQIKLTKEVLKKDMRNLKHWKICKEKLKRDFRM